jgi:hypothetical protein
MAKFKMENAGRLPDQLQSNLQAVNTLELQQQSLNESINRDAQDKMMLETQLQNLAAGVHFVGSNLEQTASREAGEERTAHPTEQQDPGFGDAGFGGAADLQGRTIRTFAAWRPSWACSRSSGTTLEKEESNAAAKAGAQAKVTNPQVAQSLENLKLRWPM